MLLPWLILIPFIGGLLCWQLERFGTKVPRWIALIAMGLTLALSAAVDAGRLYLTTPKGIPQWQSEFLLPWIPRFGISIHLALDGLSLLMVVLTGLLGVLAILCSGVKSRSIRASSTSTCCGSRRRYRRVPRHRHVPVLLLLGNDVGADVLPDRAVGPQGVGR